MTGKVLTFYLCGIFCGIDIKCAREIVRNAGYTTVPGVSDNIVGLVNLRGQVVTLFDVAKLLKLNRGIEEQGTSCIILKNRPGDPDTTGFIIDRAGDVVDVVQEMCEPLPANITHIEGRYIVEVVKLRDEIVLLLDLEAIFEN